MELNEKIGMMHDALKRIASELVGISTEDLSRAEKNILEILIKTGYAETKWNGYEVQVKAPDWPKDKWPK